MRVVKRSRMFLFMSSAGSKPAVVYAGKMPAVIYAGKMPAVIYAGKMPAVICRKPAII